MGARKRQLHVSELVWPWHKCNELVMGDTKRANAVLVEGAGGYLRNLLATGRMNVSSSEPTRRLTDSMYSFTHQVDDIDVLRGTVDRLV